MIRTTGLELHEDSASARPLSTEEALTLGTNKNAVGKAKVRSRTRARAKDGIVRATDIETIWREAHEVAFAGTLL